MALEVAAWNVLDAFSDARRAVRVLRAVQRWRPDAAVLLEAWRDDRYTSLLDGVLEDFGNSGYDVVHSLYGDAGRPYQHGIIGIVRREVAAAPQIVSLGSRNAVRMSLPDASGGVPVEFLGVHLDDRSEQERLRQVERLIEMVKPCSRVVVGGDFNAMHGADWRAQALRAVRPLAQHMQPAEHHHHWTPPQLQRIGSLAARLTGMAAGTTLQQLEAAGFTDTSTERPPTKGPFNLDHILVRGVQGFELRVDSVPPSLSDHRPVGALILPGV